MAIPASIREMKPKDLGPCIIQKQKDSFYVVEATSKWDRVEHKTVKITGKSLGRISPTDGYIPNEYALRKRAEASSSAYIVKSYGAIEMFLQLSPDIEPLLRKHFPIHFREIQIISLLELTEAAGPKMLMNAFMGSYLSDLYPCDESEVHLEDKTVRSLIRTLGLEINRIEAFMLDSIPADNVFIFDGTCYFADFGDSLSVPGHNPQHSKRRQVRVLYIFDRTTRRPLFYRVLFGAASDKSVFVDIISMLECEGSTAIADKGFYSKVNVSRLKEAKVHFVLPLLSNSALIDKSLFGAQGLLAFENEFAYKNRLLLGHKAPIGRGGNYVYTFYDARAASEEDAHALSKLDVRSIARSSDEARKISSKHHGYFSFISDLDKDPQDIYLTYKERPDVEQCFDYMKNVVRIAPFYAHDNPSLEGHAFIGHIATLYFYGLVDALHRSKLDRVYSTEDIIGMAKNIHMQKDANGTFHLSYVPEKVRNIMNTLGVKLPCNENS